MSLKRKRSSAKLPAKFAGKRYRTLRRGGKTLVVKRNWAASSLNTHRFTRYANANPSVVSIGDGIITQFSNNHTFTLGAVVNATEFGQLFDQYRIDKVVVTYQLVNNPDANNYLNSGSLVNASNFYPTVWSIADYDDNASMNISEMKERIGVKNRILMPNKKMKFVVTPKVLVQTYRTALTTGYAPRSLFIDMTNQDIPHYGLKTVIDFAGIAPATAQQYKIVQEFKYFFTCTNVR